MSFFSDFRSLLYEDISKRRKTTPFLIFIFLLVGFTVSRIWVMVFPERGVLFLRGYHVHHFFYGLVLVVIAGYIALVTDRIRLQRLSAILFGLGTGMMLDEIGLILTCGTITKGCDYWSRVTYDIFIVVVSL